MEVFEGFRAVSQAALPAAGTTVTVGNFDGVHLGHQALFREVAAKARSAGRKSVVYTFEPHPVRLLNPKLAPPRITPQDEKLRLIAEQGIDICVAEPFTAEFAALSPNEWCTDALVSALRMKEMIVGYDFTYGKGGAGNTQSLSASAGALGFSFHVLSPQSFGGVVASSTKIREFLLEGKVDGAAMLLGRPYVIQGEVVRGDARGRTIGFPTANVHSDYELVPRYGVYACSVERVATGERFAAVTNVGVRPTVKTEAAKPTIEAHLFDFSDDLYDQQVRVSFVARIREERRFESLDALKAQIAVDAEEARNLLRVDVRELADHMSVKISRERRLHQFAGYASAVFFSFLWLTSIRARAEQAAVLDDIDRRRDERADDKDKHRVILGVRPFAGVMFEDDSTSGVLGAAILVGAPIYKRLELEGSVAWARSNNEPSFFVIEVVAKWVFENETVISPHLTLGPIFSLDVEDPVMVSGGVIAGGGFSIWFVPRVAFTADANYRLLVGREISNIVSVGAGCVFRL